MRSFSLQGTSGKLIFSWDKYLSYCYILVTVEGAGHLTLVDKVETLSGSLILVREIIS